MKVKAKIVTKAGMLAVCFKRMQACKMAEEESRNRYNYNAFSDDDNKEKEMEEEEVSVGGIHQIGRRRRKRAQRWRGKRIACLSL